MCRRLCQRPGAARTVGRARPPGVARTGGAGAAREARPGRTRRPAPPARIEGGNRQLDLVDAGRAEIVAHPSYAVTEVIGNLLIEPAGAGNGQIVHHGGDSSHVENYRPGGLRLEYNTVVTRRPGITTLLFLSGEDGSATVRGNVFAAPAGGRPVVLAGPGWVELGVNWFARRWQPGVPERASGGEAILSGRDPGFAADGFVPAAGSPLIDAAPADLAPPAVRFAAPAGVAERKDPGRPDLGAFPLGTDPAGTE